MSHSYPILYRLALIALCGGSAWADAVADKIVETYQAEITKAGAAYDTLVQASTTKATKALEGLEAKAKDDSAKAEIHLLAVQLQSGMMAPAFVDPRKFDVQPAAWRPLSGLALDGSIEISSKVGIAEVSPNWDPLEIGYLKTGTLIAFRCLGGAFRVNNGTTTIAVTDPDAAGAVEILSGNAATKKWDVRQPLPGGTTLEPFVYKVPKDGTYYLRSHTTLAGLNTGLGAFEVKLGGG